MTTGTSTTKPRGLHDILSAIAMASASNDEEAPPSAEHTEVDVSSIMSSNHDDASTNEKSTTETKTDFDKICQYLDDEEWIYTAKRDRGIIITSGTGSNGTYQVILDHKRDDSILIVYVRLPAKVPQDKRLDIAEYITRANYGLMISNFELDFGDGDCRCKGSIDYSGGVLARGMIEQLIGKTAYTMNRYFPGMMRVIYGNLDAKSAIAEIEPSQSRGEAGEALAEALVQALASSGEQGASGVATPVNDDDDTESPPVAIATPTP